MTERDAGAQPTSGTAREFLIDVSRLVWRVWKGRLPTGIDRVCLAYLERFGGQAQAVVQHSGFRYVLSRRDSDRLFDLLTRGGETFRPELLRLCSAAWLRARSRSAQPGMIYLNIGHTGLEDPTLPQWIAANRLRAVYLIHDLIPISHPEFCRPGEEAKHARRMENVLSSAAGIIGNSHATIAELRSFAEARGMALPPSVAAWISGHRIPEAVAPARMDAPYFVTVGTIEGRKNHILLLQIWRKLVETQGAAAPKLLIIGQRGWEAEHALAMLDRAPALKHHVRELGSCGDEELARLIAGARALLMPSFAEGFGLPVIEALQLGTPVIASDLPVFREIAGSIPTYLDPVDGAAWQRTISAFMTNDPERERQRSHMEGYRAPDWASHFDVVEDWLKSL